MKPPKKSPGRPFRPGNPGKPKGIRHKVTQAVEALLDGEADKLTRKAVELALEGDTVALRLCLERICPPRKSRPVTLDLPEIKAAEDLVNGVAAVLKAMGAGEITPDEAATVAGVLELKRRAIETADIERRLAVLEERQKGNPA